MNEQDFFKRVEKVCDQRDKGLLTLEETLYKILEAISEFQQSPLD